MNSLNLEADVTEAQHRGSYPTVDVQENRTPNRLSVTPSCPLAPQYRKPVLGPNKYPAETPTLLRTLTAQLDPWEVDLVNFLRLGGTRANTRKKGKRAQEFAEKLCAVRPSVIWVFFIT